MKQQILFEIKKFSSFLTDFRINKLGSSVFFTDRKKTPDLEKIITNLPKNSAVIIREYDLDKSSRENFAKKIARLIKNLNLTQNKQLKIIIGKDFALALKIKADGIHFSDFERIPLQFFKKKSFPQKFIFSIACHSFRSVIKSLKLKPDIIFISPVFPTTTHLHTKSPIKNPVKNPVKNPIKNPLKNPIKNPLKNPIKNPLKNQVTNLPENFRLKNFGLKNLAKIAFQTKKLNYFSARSGAPFFTRIFALGGINAKNLRSVRKLGLSGFGAIDLFQKNS
jgi:thiamine monophosphate synthase